MNTAINFIIGSPAAAVLSADLGHPLDNPLEVVGAALVGKPAPTELVRFLLNRRYSSAGGSHLAGEPVFALGPASAPARTMQVTFGQHGPTLAAAGEMAAGEMAAAPGHPDGAARDGQWSVVPGNSTSLPLQIVCGDAVKIVFHDWQAERHLTACQVVRAVNGHAPLLQALATVALPALDYLARRAPTTDDRPTFAARAVHLRALHAGLALAPGL